MKNINNKQLSVLDKLFSYLEKLDSIENNRFQETQYHINRYEDVDVEIDIKYDIEAEPWEESVLAEISNIYEVAKEHNIYFFDCPFKIYENYFESRKNKFFEEYIDATELDFLLSELDYFSKPAYNRIFTFKNKVYYYGSYFNPDKKYILSLKRKLEFLNNKLLKYNRAIDFSFLESKSPDNTGISVVEEKNIREDQNNQDKLNSKINKSSNKSTFYELIPDKKRQEYTLKILEDLSITTNGKFNLSIKRKGALRGVVEALRDNNIISNLSLEELNYAIALEIQMLLKSKLDWSKTSDNYKRKADIYIKENPFKINSKVFEG